MIPRSTHRKIEASPTFQFKNASTITANSVLSKSWEAIDSRSKKYLPFNFTRVVNNSSEDIEFYPNQNDDQPYLVPAGTIMTIDKASVPAISSFSIKNIGDATITANQVIINCSRERAF